AKELLVDLRRVAFSTTPLAPSPQAPAHGSIAVLPLDNLSRDPEQEYFVDGMTEALITELSRIRALKVISRTSVMQYKGVKKPLPQIARELRVDTVVEGSVLRAGARVRVNAQLIQAASDQHLWAESYEREVKDILSLHSELARAIAREVHVTLTPQEQAQLARARLVNPEAYEAYLKGDYYYDKRTEEGIRKSQDYFKQAIERDPTYALAYSGLANSANGLGWYSFVAPSQNLAQAKPAALKALEIDETLAEAHAALACIRFYAERDWANAETEFKRALELDPRYANTHHWYADYLSAMGRHAEAVAEARHAREFEPLSLIINTWLGRRLYFARQYDEAISHLCQTVEMDSSFAPAHFHLGLAYEQEAMQTNAITELRTAARLSASAPVYVAELANACARAGQRREAQKLLEDLKTVSKQEYVSPYQIAAIYVGLGEKEPGLAWLEKSYTERALWLVYIKVDPQFDSLRGDSRFQDLLRRMNFPE
ncbi:MAG: tetratricopeptide repeat protein, partial [Chloroflexi bacterium]|nr:tetratricopeptide repeat protein [Chloroflexota bacterium]